MLCMTASVNFGCLLGSFYNQCKMGKLHYAPENYIGTDLLKDRILIGISEFFMSTVKNRSWDILDINDDVVTTVGAFWDIVATFLYPLFRISKTNLFQSTKFSPTDFSLITQLFKYKDEHYDYNYSGCLAICLMHKMEILSPKDISRKFFKDAGLEKSFKDGLMYNDDSKDTFMKLLVDKELGCLG